MTKPFTRSMRCAGLFLLLIISIVKECEGGPSDGTAAMKNQEKLLREMIPEPYSTAPVQSNSVPATVHVSASLARILELQENEETLVANFRLQLVWNDSRLSWKPSEYDNLEKIPVPYSKIWIPHVMLLNGVESQNSESITKPTGDVMVNHIGAVTYVLAITSRSACSIDVRYFPFDTQECEVKFGSLMTDNLHLVTEQKTVDLGSYQKNSVWDLFKATVTGTDSDSRGSEIRISLEMNRRSGPYCYSLYYPVMALLWLGVLTFALPLDNGERFPLLVGSVLSVMMYAMYITQKVSYTSDIPILANYCYGIGMLLMVSAALSVGLLKLSRLDQDGWGVPKWADTKTFKILGCILLFNTSRRKGKPRHPTARSILPQDKQENITSDEQHQDSREQRMNWTLLTNVFDRLLFTLLLFAAIVLSVCLAVIKG